MIKLSKCGIAVVLGLILGLTFSATGAFAQEQGQSMDHSKISVSAHAAGARSVMPGATKVALRDGLVHPSGAQGQCDSWGWSGCGHPRTTSRCTSQRECRSTVICRWGRWGRACQSIKTCRFRTICRRCSSSGGNSWGWNGGVGTWEVKAH